MSYVLSTYKQCTQLVEVQGKYLKTFLNFNPFK